MKENEDFLKRTDDLALKLRMNLTDLARRIDLSDGSFFGYRTGRVRITAKAWRKLEAAEIAAGIGQKPHDAVFNPPVPHDAEPDQTPADAARLDRLEAEIGGMRAEMARMASALEALAKKTTTSSPDRGREAGRKKGA